MPDINKISQKIISILKRELVILWFFTLAASFALIILQNKNKLPLGKGDFVFLAILVLLVALYKPRWIFFIFLMSIPLENIILSSGFLPIQLRPYQFLGATLVLAIIILFFSKRLPFKIFRPTRIDLMVFGLALLGFLSVINAPNRNISLKNSLVLTSFVFLYYLARNFLRNRKDLLKSAFFFAGSFLIVSGYGFYQALADKFGAKSFEVMFGRPNSTFTEPDWLGIFLCFALAVFLAILPFLKNMTNKSHAAYIICAAYLFIFLDLTLLILTLSRSAWIGAAAVILLFIFSVSFSKKERPSLNPAGMKIASTIILLAVLSLVAVKLSGLSKFDIFDRARSAATSEQKITVACEKNSQIPASVASTNELLKFGCRHINLEEINLYKAREKIVTEIFRKDPNVMTRAAIYKKTWEEFKKHPILGIGYGSITQILGADARGAGLNESSIFLQVWAGSGILGIVIFIILIGYLFIYAFRRVSPVCPLNKLIGCPVVKSDFEKTANIFLLLGLTSIILPNLFNAGLLMGTFWIALSIFVSLEHLRD